MPLVDSVESATRTAFLLAGFTTAYNVVEGVVAIFFAFESESVALLGFGADSLIEVFSAVVVLTRLSREAAARRKGVDVPVVEWERRSAVIIGVLLVALALSAVATAILRLIERGAPDTALPGLVVSAASLSFMFFLWNWKLKVNEVLQSPSLAADANCSLGCIHLSVTLFVGSLIAVCFEATNTRNPLWWLDAAAALVIAVMILRDGVGTLANAFSPDFDGTCGCCHPAPAPAPASAHAVEVGAAADDGLQMKAAAGCCHGDGCGGAGESKSEKAAVAAVAEACPCPHPEATCCLGATPAPCCVGDRCMPEATPCGGCNEAVRDCACDDGPLPTATPAPCCIASAGGAAPAPATQAPSACCGGGLEAAAACCSSSPK